MKYLWMSNEDAVHFVSFSRCMSVKRCRVDDAQTDVIASGDIGSDILKVPTP